MHTEEVLVANISIGAFAASSAATVFSARLVLALLHARNLVIGIRGNDKVCPCHIVHPGIASTCVGRRAAPIREGHPVRKDDGDITTFRIGTAGCYAPRAPCDDDDHH